MKKKRSSIGCLFWLALILLVAVVFLFNRKTIMNVIRKTGFETVITERKKDTPPSVIREESSETENSTTEDTEKTTEFDLIEIEEGETGESESGETIEESRNEEEQEEPVPQGEPEGKIRNAKLYFIDVDDSGSITLKAVVRAVRFFDSPLTETLKALLGGLLPSELNMELITLIPDNTEIQSVSVRDGVAYISFNDSFRFNSLGREGYIAQLKQIVYTATEFPTVSSVQILIGGREYDYLGGEGVYIGQPLTRNSF